MATTDFVKEHDQEAAHAVAMEGVDSQTPSYPQQPPYGRVYIQYEFWSGGAQETIKQEFRGSMRQVKSYAAGFTRAIDTAPDWGGGRLVKPDDPASWGGGR